MQEVANSVVDRLLERIGPAWGSTFMYGPHTEHQLTLVARPDAQRAFDQFRAAQAVEVAWHSESMLSLAFACRVGGDDEEWQGGLYCWRLDPGRFAPLVVADRRLIPETARRLRIRLVDLARTTLAERLVVLPVEFAGALNNAIAGQERANYKPTWLASTYEQIVRYCGTPAGVAQIVKGKATRHCIVAPEEVTAPASV